MLMILRASSLKFPQITDDLMIRFRCWVDILSTNRLLCFHKALRPDGKSALLI